MIRVSCVIPAYNEAATIRAVVGAARACPQVDEVLVVSDGSTDETTSRAVAAGADRVIVLPRNQGKGSAVLRAAREARGEILLLLDADLCGLRPAHLTRLLAPVLAGQADMAVAVFAGDPMHRAFPRFSGQRALRRSLLRSDVLRGTGFGFEMVLDHVARRARARIVRVRVSGLTHRPKRHKYGTLRGFRLQVKASSDLLRQAHRAVPRPSLRHWMGRRRRRPMGPWLLALALLAVMTLPVFVLRPRPVAAARLEPLAPLAGGDRLLVVVAHPDDEIIGAGGLIATALDAGVPVRVLILSNGDSNRVSAAVAGRALLPTRADFVTAGRVRQGESLEALRRLGLPADAVVFLGFPDRFLGQVLQDEHAVTRSSFTGLDRAAYPGVSEPGAPYTGATLRRLVAAVVAETRPTLVVTHAPFDRHSDHRAAYDLVERARGGAGIAVFLVHAPGFPRPLRSAPRSRLLPPEALTRPPGWTWVRFELSPDAQSRKQTAVTAFRSQRDSPYLRLLLASFVRTNELFAVPAPPP